MRTCNYCGGGIAEQGEVTGFAGKWCHCIPNHIESIKPYPHKTPKDIKKQWDEFIKLHGERSPGEREAIEEVARHLQKGNIQKPKLSHIINLCEQLSIDHLRILIEVLKAMQEAEK